MPTLVECGFKEATASETGGFFVARGTPQAQIDKLAAALEAALQDPLTRAEQQAAGLRPILLQTEAYGDALKTEHAHWRELIAKTRFNLHG